MDPPRIHDVGSVRFGLGSVHVEISDISLHFASGSFDIDQSQFRDRLASIRKEDEAASKGHGEEVRRGKLGGKLWAPKNAAALAVALSVRHIA